MATRADFGRAGYAKRDQDRSDNGFTWQSRSHRADGGNGEIIRRILHYCDRALFTDARHTIDRRGTGRAPPTACARRAVAKSQRARAPHCGGCSHRSQAHHLSRAAEMMMTMNNGAFADSKPLGMGAAEKRELALI